MASKPEFHREFRLGLVVYGGVSLAVYMNGVCREFYNAVRGRGIYKLIKALTDSDIVVDIISGTSAGGINGVLLSYALTNSSEEETFDFKNFANVWRESGDINQLLRPVNSKGDVNSILDGENYYQGQLADAFQTVWDRREPAPPDDWFSPFKELDLFVTGTDVLGKASRYFDRTGKLIEVNDHHAVFVLKHREDRKEPFQPKPDTIPQRALAKLCRITSCFPVAFPVVTVKLDEKPAQPNKQEAAYPDWDIDAELVKWGNLNNRVKPKKEDTVDGHQLHFVDGGVLDNRPFSYTIREIYYRHFYRPVNRKLFYIDPSPDKFLDSPPFKRMAKPNIWESAIDSLVGLPSYQSIAGDLQEITRQNENVRRYKFLRSTAVRVFEAKLREGKLQQPGEHAEETSTQITPGTEQDIYTIPSEEQIYLRCRLVGLRDRVLPLIIGLNQDETVTQNDDKKALLERAAELITSYISDREKQKERDNFLHKKGQEIHNLDIDYSIRQHFFILDAIVQSMEQEKYLVFHQNLEQLARYLNWQLSLLEAIKAAIEEMLTIQGVQKDFAKLINKATGNPGEIRPKIYDYLLHLHRFLLDVDALPPWKPTSNSDTKNFFQKLPDTLPTAIDATSAHEWLTTQDVTDVFQQLKAIAKQLEKVDELGDELGGLQKNPLWKDKYKSVPGMRNKCEAYYSILSKIEKTSKEIISRLGEPKPEFDREDLRTLKKELLDKFDNFEYIDQQVYPYEYLSDIQAEDPIEIARICPEDANKGFGKDKRLEERLAGVQLGAFGGFFKKSWRSNDILWGRLDGLNRLVDCLLTPKTIENFPKFLKRNNIDIRNPNALDPYLAELLEQAFPNPTFPGESPTDRELRDAKLNSKKAELQADLRDLAHCNEAQDFTDFFKDHPQFLDKLVEFGQLAILQTDLENVLGDAIEEQFTWNYQLIAPPSKSKDSKTPAEASKQPQFSAIAGYFDRALTPFATKSLVNSSIQEILRDPDKTKQYFNTEYRVGSEKIKTNIPPLILEKLMARSGLVVRNILQSKPTGEVLSKSVTFQFVDRLLQTFYLWVETKNPTTSTIPNLLRPLFSWLGVIAVVVGVAFLVSQIPWLLLVGIITILILQLIYSSIGQSQWRKRIVKVISLILVAAILASILVGLPIPQDGTIRLKNPFSDRCPMILTKWTFENCTK